MRMLENPGPIDDVNNSFIDRFLILSSYFIHSISKLT